MTQPSLHGRLDLSSATLSAWLGQFSQTDQPIAKEFLESLLFVKIGDMTSALTAKLEAIAKKHGSCAVFVEGPVRKYAKKPLPLYKYPRRKKRRRSDGNAPPPVRVERGYAHEVGSEGHIASAMTSLARAQPELFTLHPSMSQWRELQHNRLILVTDFIGSGTRVVDFLDAALKTPTIRSWVSSKHVSFDVVTYSATADGEAYVRSHRANPQVHIIRGCPTIHDLGAAQREQFRNLCIRNCPIRPKGKFTPLGYGDSGGMMVFHHSAPNNTPLILHKGSRSWTPLFKQRSPNQVLSAVSETAQKEEIQRALITLRQSALSASKRVLKGSLRTQQMVLVLAALRRTPRTASVVSARTNLPVDLVETTMARARAQGLISETHRLLEKAYSEFAYLRQPMYSADKKIVVSEAGINYIPEQLRPPVDLN